jgi:hypothetical protein
MIRRLQLTPHMVVHQGALSFEVDAGGEQLLKLANHPHHQVRGGVQVQHDANGEEGQHGGVG